MGGPTVATVLANKLTPGLVDRYLSGTGFDSQQTDEPVDPDREDNLWEPVGGEHGANGVFDAGVHDRSFQLELTIPKRAGVAVGGVAALAALVRGAWELRKQRGGQ